MKKIKFVDLVFENCEGVRLLPDMFRALHISKITRDVSINIAQYKDGEQLDDLYCERFSIIINKKGLSEAKFYPEIVLKDDPKNLRERLEKWRDITHVDLIYSYDKKNLPKDHEYIGVPWYRPEDLNDAYKDVYDCTNFYQQHIWEKNRWWPYLKDGEMIIKIEKGDVIC